MKKIAFTLAMLLASPAAGAEATGIHDEKAGSGSFACLPESVFAD